MPISSRAAILFEPGRPLRVEDIVVNDPGPGEILIKLDAASLCHSDLSYIDGKMKHPVPAIFGHEGIGTAVKLGEGVHAVPEGATVIPYLIPDCGQCAYCQSGRTNFCAQMGRNFQPGFPTGFRLNGEPVPGFLSLGTFSQYLVVPQDQVQVVDPRTLRPEAACIGCGVSTGLGAALLTAKIERGASVIVFGLGGVGLNVVQGARIAGAATIIGVDLNPDKEAAARRLGATHFVNASLCDPVQEVRTLTAIGVDYAFDCVGHPKLFEQGLACLSKGGWAKMISVGILPDSVPVPVKWSDMTGRHWQGTLMGGAKRQDVGRFAEWFVDGKIDLGDMVTHEISLDDINHGFDHMRQGKSNRVVIRYG